MADLLAAAQRIVAMGLTVSEVGLIVWLASGGIVYLLRGISFWIDTLLVNFIASIYSYFMDLLEGTMFNDTVTEKLLSNVYVFIGVFVFFRLAAQLIKYIMDPAAVMDEKAGVNALIKRVVIGLIGMLSVPLIFNTAMDLQTAVIKDQLIQQLILPKDMLDATSKNVDDAGKYIGTYVFSGFLNPKTGAPNRVKKEFESAMELGDFSTLDFNGGGFMGTGYSSYNYNYFYLLSTFVLGYVLYLMLKYCLDIVVRFFKLLLYQLFAPIAMVEYMINGSENGVFKNWKQATLSTYFMLFVRVLSIWFVVFVMTLMSGTYENYSGDSLLASNDYLLRALIIIGLLGFMIDLPKIVGNILGLDLEQESSATGFLKSIGGIIKGVGMGALAMGGAALGGAAGAIGGVQKAGLSSLANRNKAIKSQMNKNPGMTRQAAKTSLGIGKMGRQGFKNAVSTATSGKVDELKNQIRANNSSLSDAQVEKQAQKIAKQQAKQEVLTSDLGKGRSMSNDSLKSTASTIKSAALGTLSGMAGAAIASTSAGKAIQSGYSNVSSRISQDRAKERQSAEQEATEAYRQHQMATSSAQLQTADQQLEATRRINYKLGVDQKMDIDEETNPEFKSQAQGLKDAGFKGISDHVQVTAEKVVEMKDDTKVIRDNSDASLVQQAAANEKLDNIKTTSQITADNTVHIKDNTKVVADSVTNIEKNVDTIVTQNETMNTTLNKIEDNTFATGIDSLNHMEDSGYISKAPKSVNDFKPAVKDNDIETL